MFTDLIFNFISICFHLTVIIYFLFMRDLYHINFMFFDVVADIKLIIIIFIVVNINFLIKLVFKFKGMSNLHKFLYYY